MRKTPVLAIIFFTTLLCSCLSTSGKGIESIKNGENITSPEEKKIPEVYVEMKFDFSDIKESEALWLIPEISEKLEKNLLKYTDFGFLNENNIKDIINIQTALENSSQNNEFISEKSHLSEFATDKLFTTVKKTSEGYVLLSTFTDVKTGENKAIAESSPKSSISGLFLQPGSAVDEITISLCQQLGFPISELEKKYIMNGESDIVLKDRLDIYSKEVKESKNIISALDKKITSLTSQEESSQENSSLEESSSEDSSSELSSSLQLEDFSQIKILEAEKAHGEEKLQLAQENKKRISDEIKRQNNFNIVDSKRSGKKKAKFNSIGEEINKNLKAASNLAKNDKTLPLINQIQIIELKKKAVINIHNTIMAERKIIYDRTLNNILSSKKQIETNPYTVEELQEDGITPSVEALKQRETLYIETKENIITSAQNEFNQKTAKLNNQKNLLLNEINNDYEKLGSRKISTLGNELAVTRGEYNKDKHGWDLTVTVKSNDMILFQTESFLSFGVFIGKDPREYALDDYIGYRDDLDYYENLLLGNEPLLVFELEYSAVPESIENPSQYNFTFSNFKCYDTQTLTVNENKLSSSKINDLTLNEEKITKQMLPVCNLAPVLEDIPSLKSDLEIELKIIQNREVIDKSFIKILPRGTSGSYGKKGIYVEFGTWPQSIKSDEIIIDDSKIEEKNGWNCYNGSDGFYYVKVQANPQESGSQFSNGKIIEKGTEYYFKIEPVKWRVVSDDYQGGKLLVAENILATGCFDKDLNNYKYSEIREWLNNDFLNKAFTKEAIENINIVTVDNSAKSTGYTINQSSCENTEDKIFLLSAEEITMKSYGFNSNNEGFDIVKKREPTDYSKASGAFSNIYKQNSYWLRSPYYDSDRTVRFVDNDGNLIRNDNITSFREGIVPALTVDFKY